MGELAAIITACCWAMSSVFFTTGGKEVGSIMVNRIRLIFAVSLVMVAHLVLLGSLLPVNAGWERWMWLGLSGFIGLVLGDSFLFQAYVLIGTRISTLLMSFAPVIGAFIAWIFLKESLTPLQILGVALAIAGIALVVLEKPNGDGSHDIRKYGIGILCGLGGAAGQAGGLVLAKQGLIGDFPAVSGVAIRMLVAMLAIWGLTLISGQFSKTMTAFQNKRAVHNVAAGSFVGPFIGVWLSLVAVQLTFVGIASTLMALTPIIILPVSKWVFKEQVTRRAVIGTLVCLVGVAVIITTT
ncbi:MAG: DMT family transporter [Anaerolineaceae bacterium]|nr:DMT family transporter [Anaerolineaceae bacterium]